MKSLNEYLTPETNKRTPLTMFDHAGQPYKTDFVEGEHARSLEQRLGMCREALGMHRKYMITRKCHCTVANEAGDRDICGRCVALIALETVLKATEPKL